jgi:CelD/BcsL family acetyltransferase involved in cellulose biosynthesis
MSNRRFNGQFTTFEAGVWRNYSIGLLLMNKVVEWAFHHGVETFDFGIGDDTYKQDFCELPVPLHYASFAGSAKGRAARFVLGLRTLVHAQASWSGREMRHASHYRGQGRRLRALAHAALSVAVWPCPESLVRFLSFARAAPGDAAELSMPTADEPVLRPSPWSGKEP